MSHHINVAPRFFCCLFYAPSSTVISKEAVHSSPTQSSIGFGRQLASGGSSCLQTHPPNNGYQRLKKFDRVFILSDEIHILRTTCSQISHGKQDLRKQEAAQAF
jgi:hypothetical protein